MPYPDTPRASEDFATWIRPHVDELVDQSLAEIRERVATGGLLTQQEQLCLIDQLIKDRRERALLIERGVKAVQ